VLAEMVRLTDPMPDVEVLLPNHNHVGSDALAS
jgi:hypothetical protein